MVQELNRIKVEEKLKSMEISVFTPREFAGIFKVPQNTAAKFISRNIKSGLFVKLRNNVYLIKDSHPSRYYVANKLYEPSYVSLETALSHYGIIPEVVYAMTSITTKASREYQTPLGEFTYQRIKKQAYTGYQLQSVEGQKAFIADPEKALADYLYFVVLKKISLNDRLELRDINRSKLTKYAALFNKKRIFALIKQIYVEYRKPRKIY